MSKAENGKGARSHKKQSMFEPIRVRTHRHGMLLLRWFSVGDLEFVEELLDYELPARAFTARFIHHQLIKPELDLEIVQSWQDRTLARVAWNWAGNSEGIEKHLPEGDNPFEGFKAAITAYIEEQRRRFRESMKQLISPSFIITTLPHFEDFQRAIGAQVLQYAKESSSALVRIIQEASSIQSLAIDRTNIAQAWFGESAVSNMLRSATGLEAIVIVFQKKN